MSQLAIEFEATDGAPAIGSRWRSVNGTAWEYVGADTTPESDPTYCHVLRCVQPTKWRTYAVGDVIFVELPWFQHAATRV